jgi:SAM-dependent methyltransferase
MTSPDSDRSPPALDFTGERFTPECVREIFYEHWHRYAWARGLVGGLDVLDCACGEGYGSRLLADTAASVTGVDVSADAIGHARRRYARDKLDFVESDALSLPFDDDRFDAVVSFETLEHLAEHDELLTEFRRVLRPDGFLLLSSPDRRTYSDDTGFVNEFHVRELYRDELEALLGRHFPNFRLFGQKLMFHSALWRLDEAGDGATEHLTAGDDGSVARAARPAPEPLYFLALAAADAATLPDAPGLSLFDDRAESVYAHYNEEVRKHIRAGHLLAERDAEIAALKASKTPLWTRIRQWLGGRR